MYEWKPLPRGRAPQVLVLKVEHFRLLVRKGTSSQAVDLMHLLAWHATAAPL